jgi:hypothetical protein
MWIGINSEQLWEFCKNQKMILDDQIVKGPFPKFIDNQTNVWIKTDNRFNEISIDFRWPIYLSHIEGVLPINDEAQESLNQLLATFPGLSIFLRRIDV